MAPAAAIVSSKDRSGTRRIVVSVGMLENPGPSDLMVGRTPPQELLAAENVSLRLLLTQAEVNAQALLAQAGIDAKEREASDKLQKLILEELHHRIKKTLATVSAIASQSLRNARAPSTPSTPSKAVCWR